MDVRTRPGALLRSICLLTVCAASVALNAAVAQEAAVYRAIAAAPAGEPFFAGPVPRAAEILDDATLNDLASVGDHVWAVGDRGALVRSHDAGATWQTMGLPVDARLTSVCFLTDRIGFVGGTVYDPSERQFVGMILKTSDGGDSWTVSAGSRTSTLVTDLRGRTNSGLPPVRWMRFFDLQNGVAVCSPQQPFAESMVLQTDDGGATWKAYSCESTGTAWTAAAFRTAKDGVVVGRGNSYGAVVGSQVVELARREPIARSVHAASVTAGKTSWLVGDGGFVLCSTNGGISWKPPAERLPVSLNNVLDYYDVDQKNGRVCIVGRPGTAVLMADADGRNWSVGRLAGTVPLRTVRFVTDSVLVAAGAMGVIHRSADGGQTWTPVRNHNYRAAVLVMTPNPEDTSFRLLTQIGGNEGFRTVVTQVSPRWLPGRFDDSHTAATVHAVTQAGGSAYESEWMFVRNKADHALVRDALLDAWGLQTDGNVDRLLPARLAAQIMVWRPDVICLESQPGEQLSQILQDVLPTALELAAGQSQTEEGRTLASVGLQPWRVQRLVVRQPDGTQSPLQYQADGLLSRLQTSTELIADHCRRQIVVPRPFEKMAAADTYRAWQPGAAVATPGRLLAGLQHAPGSVARRQVTLPEDFDPQALETLVQKKRIEHGALIGQAQQAGTPLAVIASLQQVGRDLPAALALRQLQQLAELYAARQNLDAEIAILKEIARRFPDRPETADAAEKLFLYYSSGELRMLRRRENQSQADPGPAIARIPGIVPAPAQLSPQGPPSSGIQQTSGIHKPPVSRGGTGSVFANSQGQVEDAVDIQWDRNARAAFELLQRIAPSRAAAPRLLIRQASNLHRTDAYADSRTVLSRAASGDGLFAFLALAQMQGEHGLAETPLPVLHVMPAQTAPFLDGDLSDACWQDAKEIRLQTATPSGDASAALGVPSCLMMMTWDSDYVYLAGRVEKSSRAETMDPTRARRHDADHGTRDRVEFSFDLDRDYTTAFHFVLDETGQTSEHCWGKRSWNPQWYVASEADADVWRFEVAIPVRELQSGPLSAGAFWTTQIRRVAPGELEQRVVTGEEVATDPAAAGYGLLRFVRPRR